MSRARYTLRADISECYASIYTHSLEWALHTKAVAKAQLLAKGPPLLGGLLDAAVRNGQDGQTKGIPVGPDTSLLLAEIIFCAIDVDMQLKHPQTANYCIRLVDDLEFAAQSRGEAEDVLLTWDALLNSHGLVLNPTKTEIIEGPILPELPWRIALSQFTLRTSNDTLFTNDLHSLFSLAFDYYRQYPTDAVLGYAINRVNPRPRGLKSWTTFAHLLLASITVDPSCLRIAAEAFSLATVLGLQLDTSLIAETLDSMCSFHAPLEHGSEVAWSLAILRDLDLPISSQAAARIAAMQDNCSLLLLFDFIARKRISGAVPDMTGPVSRAEDPMAWKSEDWLLAYECARHGWANDANFKSVSAWAELLKIGVGFFLSVSAPMTEPSVATTPGPPGTSDLDNAPSVDSINADLAQPANGQESAAVGAEDEDIWLLPIGKWASGDEGEGENGEDTEDYYP